MLFWLIVMGLIVYHYLKKNGVIQQKTDTKQARQRNAAHIEQRQAAPLTPNRTAETRSNRAKASAKPDILTRAQQNAKKYEKDVTLETLEQEHNHTERSARTISKEELWQKKEEHPHNAAHVSGVISEESESILGTIEDLMVKGYDGRLSFERDFVGEGMDMISRFTV